MNEGLFEFAQQIALNLDGWHLLDPQPFDHAVCLGGQDGGDLMIGVNGFAEFNQDARVEVSGRWPEAVTINQCTVTFYPRGESASITAAVKRGPEKVARDVERRLLPKYLLLYAEMKERKESYLAKEARRCECLEQLAKAAGSRGDLSSVGNRVRFDWPGAGWGYADVNVGQDITVSFELHAVAYEKALELVGMLAVEERSER